MNGIEEVRPNMIVGARSYRSGEVGEEDDEVEASVVREQDQAGQEIQRSVCERGHSFRHGSSPPMNMVTRGPGMRGLWQLTGAIRLPTAEARVGRNL